MIPSQNDLVSESKKVNPDNLRYRGSLRKLKKTGLFSFGFFSCAFHILNIVTHILS